MMIPIVSLTAILARKLLEYNSILYLRYNYYYVVFIHDVRL